jgi:hypothetical protein
MTDKNVGGRDRLVRALLAVVLTILSVRWLKRGKKGRGLLAGIGALNFGFNATTGYCGANETLDIDTTAGDSSETGIGSDVTSTSEDVRAPSASTDSVTPTTSTSESGATAQARLTCAFCGKPIEAGQRRGPNDQGQIVHEECA